MTKDKPSGKRRIVNRAARERDLIAAAIKLFSSRGYEATTTREIAAAADCAEGLISRYFNGKAGLLRALIHRHFDHGWDELKDAMPSRRTVEGEIAQLLGRHIEHIWEDRDFLRIIVPRVILNASLAQEVDQLGPARQVAVMAERLARHAEFLALPAEEREALPVVLQIIGFMFGFLRPVMGEDPIRAKEKALTVARMLSRAL
jgi:AcrR family transcriptional regulator